MKYYIPKTLVNKYTTHGCTIQVTTTSGSGCGHQRGQLGQELHGLEAEGRLKSPDKEPVPMLVAPKRGVSGWDDRYITSQEMNQFIKKLFADGGRPIAGRKLTTHSMKATGLSWCSKMGVPQEHRAILAGHATSVQAPLSCIPGICCRVP